MPRQSMKNDTPSRTSSTMTKSTTKQPTTARASTNNNNTKTKTASTSSTTKNARVNQATTTGRSFKSTTPTTTKSKSLSTNNHGRGKATTSTTTSTTTSSTRHYSSSNTFSSTFDQINSKLRTISNRAKNEAINQEKMRIDDQLTSYGRIEDAVYIHKEKPTSHHNAAIDAAVSDSNKATLAAIHMDDNVDNFNHESTPTAASTTNNNNNRTNTSSTTTTSNKNNNRSMNNQSTTSTNNNNNNRNMNNQSTTTTSNKNNNRSMNNQSTTTTNNTRDPSSNDTHIPTTSSTLNQQHHTQSSPSSNQNQQNQRRGSKTVAPTISSSFTRHSLNDSSINTRKPQQRSFTTNSQRTITTNSIARNTPYNPTTRSPIPISQIPPGAIIRDTGSDGPQPSSDELNRVINLSPIVPINLNDKRPEIVHHSKDDPHDIKYEEFIVTNDVIKQNLNSNIQPLHLQPDTTTRSTSLFSSNSTPNIESKPIPAMSMAHHNPLHRSTRHLSTSIPSTTSVPFSQYDFATTNTVPSSILDKKFTQYRFNRTNLNNKRSIRNQQHHHNTTKLSSMSSPSLSSEMMYNTRLSQSVWDRIPKTESMVSVPSFMVPVEKKHVIPPEFIHTSTPEIEPLHRRYQAPRESFDITLGSESINSWRH